jgi:hypothetical protein
MIIFLDAQFQAVTPTVGFKPVVRQPPDARLKPKIQGAYSPGPAGYVFSYSWLRAVQIRTCRIERSGYFRRFSFSIKFL